MNHNALSRNGVSEQTQNNNVHVKEQSKSITHDEQINQSINQNHEISYVGPPPKPDSFFAWINSINSLTWNYEI